MFTCSCLLSKASPSQWRDTNPRDPVALLLTQKHLSLCGSTLWQRKSGAALLCLYPQHLLPLFPQSWASLAVDVIHINVEASDTHTWRGQTAWNTHRQRAEQSWAQSQGSSQGGPGSKVGLPGGPHRCVGPSLGGAGQPYANACTGLRSFPSGITPMLFLHSSGSSWVAVICWARVKGQLINQVPSMSEARPDNIQPLLLLIHQLRWSRNAARTLYIF